MDNIFPGFLRMFKNPAGITILSFLMVLLVGLFDFITNPEFSFSLFYLIPISFNTWYGSRRSGILVSFVCGITWLLVDLSSANYENLIAPYWNSGIRLGFFVIVVYLLSEIKFLYRNLENMVEIRTNELTDEIDKKVTAEAELRRSRNLYQDLVENINEVYYTADEKGYFRYVSPNFFKTISLSEDSLANTSFYDFIYPDDVERVRQFYADKIAEKAADVSSEFRITGSDNTLKWFEQTSRILWDDHGKTVEIRNLLRNIDERKAAEISLIKSEMNFQKLFSAENKLSEEDYIRRMLVSDPAYLIKSLAEKIDEISDKISGRVKQALGFSSLASHELRTPLAIIRNQLEENLREDIPLGELKQTTASIYDEVLRLQRIIGDLLKLSTMEAGKLKLHKKPVQVNTLLTSFYEEASLLAQEKEIKIELSIPEKSCIEIDEAYFLQMLFNIFDNALKHTPAHGTIQIGSVRSEKDIVIFMKDSGKGIPPDIIHKLFTPFYRNNTEYSTEGTGLGLLLSKWITELHSGKIEIQSEVGKGTKVMIKLPLNLTGGK